MMNIATATSRMRCTYDHRLRDWRGSGGGAVLRLRSARSRRVVKVSGIGHFDGDDPALGEIAVPLFLKIRYTE